MVIRQPEYYDAFHCLAGKCPDSCCKEWAVAVDGESLAKYRELPGALGNAVRQALLEEDGEVVLFPQGGQCPLQQRDGLCRIHKELGECGLCQVCREYPRLRHDYGTFLELGLELSCPEAARLILADTGRVFTREAPGGEKPDYDKEMMELLLESREYAFSLLAESRRTPAENLALLLMWGAYVQSQIDGWAPSPFSPEKALAAGKSAAEPGNIRTIRDPFLGLEILTHRWREKLESKHVSPLSQKILSLARYFVNRYWLQAVSDLELYGRVKFAVISCLLVSSLEGNFTENAQLYSKEIENDPDNLAALLDAVYEVPAFIDRKLLGLLL